MKFNLLDFLLPRETKFFDFFIEQADILIEAANIFKNLSINISKFEESEIKIEVNRIKEMEIKGDIVESKIIKELNQTFITPFDREDIHHMAITIDKSLDILTSLSNKIEIYGIKNLPKNVINFSNLIVTISQDLRKLIDEFKKKSNIDYILNNMHNLENKADYLFYLSVGELFKQVTDPIEIIKLKEVYEYLEKIVDKIDSVGKIVRRILIKQG